MKKAGKITVLIVISVLVLISSVGCINNNNNAIEEASPSPPLPYEIKSDKMEYNYGEEILIELLFYVNDNGIPKKDGKTYCVKIKESPYYEIIGDSEIYTDGSENTEMIDGVYGSYWYRVAFKIKITKESNGRQCPEIVFKCVEDDWLISACEAFVDSSAYDMMYNIDDPEYPLAICRETFGFVADSDGITFTDPESCP